MRAADLVFLFDLIRTYTGISLDASKGYLLTSRLSPLLREEGLTSLSELCAALRSNGSGHLLQSVLDAMTTNETSFFRDHLPFEHLAEEVIPRLIAARGDSKKFRVWSAASSSGQEAATLAILLMERFPELKGWDLKILASDVSSRMVERCESLTFTHGEMARGMPANLRDKYFRATKGGWQATSVIRDLIETRQINLIEPLVRVEQQDLVLLRNVLIYFDEPTRDGILSQVERALPPDGYLLLGTAEKPRSRGFERAFGTQANVFRRAS